MRVNFVLVLSILIGASPVYATAATAPTMTVRTAPTVFITEFQTNGGSAAQEFIELYNATDTDISFDDAADSSSPQWKLQFFNSTSVKSGAPTWNTPTSTSNSIPLHGVIPARDYFLLSSKDYLPAGVEADQVYDPSSSHLMADTGGGLQLMSTSVSSSNTSSIAYDRVMWLDPASNSVMPWNVLAKPGTTKSQQRIPNDDGEYIDSNNNLADFAIKQDITPLAAWTMPIPEIEPEQSPIIDVPADAPAVPIDTVPSGGAVSPDDSVVVPPLVTELLPNPASPLSDAADEYIELYNPNTTEFDLKGYGIEVGTTTMRMFTISESYLIPAQSYQTFYARDTHLSLSNSGSQARLRDRLGAVVSESASYTNAADGAAWALIAGVWQWTDNPTPSTANLASAASSAAVGQSAAAAQAAKTTKSAIAKSTKAKTASAKVKGVSSTKKTKVAKVKKPVKKKTTAFSTTGTVKPKPPIHPGILVAVVVCAILYGLYEYRHDISNRVAQFRRNRTASPTDREQAAWQRSYSAK